MCLQLYYIICSIILSIPLFMRFSGMGLKRSERPVLTGGLRFLTEIHQHPLLTIFCPLYQVPIWKESANCRRARGRRAATPPWFILPAPAKWSKETEATAVAVLRTTPGRAAAATPRPQRPCAGIAAAAQRAAACSSGRRRPGVLLRKPHPRVCTPAPLQGGSAPAGASLPGAKGSGCWSTGQKKKGCTMCSLFCDARTRVRGSQPVTCG